MIVRHKVSRNRHLNGKNDKVFCIRFGAFARRHLVPMIALETPKQIVELQYLASSKYVTQGMARKLMFDWAITMGVHPWSLGLITENPAILSVAPGIELIATVIPNVFKRDAREEKVLKGNDISIPFLIHHLNVKAAKASPVRAVIVTEHRNIRHSLPNVTEHLNGVIFVQTSGYASMATREFLHLLCKIKEFKKVPFLFFSDHDFQGVHIFLNLKYGSKSTAWASATQVCPRLRWVGPTVKDLKMVVPEGKLAHLEEVFECCEATDTDRQLMAAFEHSGVLDHEEVLAQELRLMLDKGDKFAFSRMSHYRQNGMELYMVEKLQELAPEKHKRAIVET